MSLFNPFAQKSQESQQQPPLATDKAQIQPNTVNPARPDEQGVAAPTTTTPKPDPDNQKPKNPLDNFKDLYNIDPNAPEPEAAPTMQLTDEMLDKVVPSLDFQAGLAPEVVQGLQSGDPASISAALSQVGANAYKLSMQHNAALVNDHVTRALKHFKPEVDAQVASNLTNQHLQQLPNADNPVIQAELQRVSKTLQDKYPAATPDWIAQQANVYLTQLGKQLTPQPQKTTQDPPQDVDFAKLLLED